jgi:hypothetical protein
MKPGMKGRASLGRQQEQPQRQRKTRDHSVKTPGGGAVYWERSVTQIICNIPNHFARARLINDFY